MRSIGWAIPVLLLALIGGGIGYAIGDQPSRRSMHGVRYIGAGWKAGGPASRSLG